MRITIERASRSAASPYEPDRWSASCKGSIGTGSSAKEAVGDLLIRHGEILFPDLEIVTPAPKAKS